MQLPMRWHRIFKSQRQRVANAAAQADQMIPMAASVAVNVSTEKCNSDFECG